MAASQVVSLRLSNEELEYLQEQQLEGESLSATIKRLAIGDAVCKPGSKQTVNTDTAQLKEEIKTEILEAVAELIQPLRDALIDDREKLERLANTINNIIESVPVPNAVNTVNTVNNYQQSNGFEGMTKAQLKKILDESGIKYGSRASHPELVELCLTKNFGNV